MVILTKMLEFCRAVGAWLPRGTPIATRPSYRNDMLKNVVQDECILDVQICIVSFFFAYLVTLYLLFTSHHIAALYTPVTLQSLPIFPRGVSDFRCFLLVKSGSRKILVFTSILKKNEIFFLHFNIKLQLFSVHYHFEFTL